MANEETIMMKARGSLGICGLLIGRVSSMYKLSMRCQKVRNKLTFLILQLVLVNTRGGRLRRQKIRKLAPGIEAGSRGTDQNPPVYITTVLRQLCYICWNLNTSSTLSQGAVKKRSGTWPWAQCPWPGPRMCSESLRKCTQAARGQHARCTRGVHPQPCFLCCGVFEHLWVWIGNLRGEIKRVVADFSRSHNP